MVTSRPWGHMIIWQALIGTSIVKSYWCFVTSIVQNVQLTEIATCPSLISRLSCWREQYLIVWSLSDSCCIVICKLNMILMHTLWNNYLIVLFSDLLTEWLHSTALGLPEWTLYNSVPVAGACSWPTCDRQCESVTQTSHWSSLRFTTLLVGTCIPSVDPNWSDQIWLWWEWVLLFEHVVDHQSERWSEWTIRSEAVKWWDYYETTHAFYRNRRGHACFFVTEVSLPQLFEGTMSHCLANII